MNLEEIQKLALKTMGKRQSHVSREKGYVYFHGQRGAIPEKVIAALNFPQSIEFFLEKDRFLREFVERFRLESTGELWGIRKN